MPAPPQHPAPPHVSPVAPASARQTPAPPQDPTPPHASHVAPAYSELEPGSRDIAPPWTSSEALTDPRIKPSHAVARNDAAAEQAHRSPVATQNDPIEQIPDPVMPAPVMPAPVMPAPVVPAPVVIETTAQREIPPQSQSNSTAHVVPQPKPDPATTEHHGVAPATMPIAAEPSQQPEAEKLAQDVDPRSTTTRSATKWDPGYYFFAVLHIFNKISQFAIDAFNAGFSVDNSVRTRYYQNKGIACLLRGRYGSAAFLLERALRGRPDDQEILRHLGACRLKQDRVQEGIVLLEKAARQGPLDSQLAAALGLAYIHVKDYAPAARLLEAGVHQDPGNFTLNYRWGLALDHLEQYQPALSALEAAREIRPDQAKVYQAMGFVLEKMGHYEQQVVCFKKAMELEPDLELELGADLGPDLGPDLEPDLEHDLHGDDVDPRS